jgi:hypothetical protein
MIKLYCSATLIAALLMAISVFIGNISHTEFKSQMRKRKIKKTEQVIDDSTKLDDIETSAPESPIPEL